MKLIDRHGETIRYEDCFKNGPSPFGIYRSLFIDTPVHVFTSSIQIAAEIPYNGSFDEFWFSGEKIAEEMFQLRYAEKIPGCKQCQNFLPCLLRGSLNEEPS